MSEQTQQGLAVIPEVANRQMITTQVARDLAERLRFMIVGGKKLADPEVWALAQYSAMNDLNPFASECYYLPGIGPGPGIAGWRKKANEQLEFEAKEWGIRGGAHFWTEFVQATPAEAKFDPAKDIAWKCILRDTITHDRWQRDYISTWIQVRQLGEPEPKKTALEIVGPEPVWIGVGVVQAGENFGGDKMDRNERAQKRAEKMAIRKRFQRIRLPEPTEFEEDAMPADFFPQPALEAEHEHRPDSAVMAELGFPDDAPAQPPAPEAPAAPEEKKPELVAWPNEVVGKLAVDWKINANQVKNILAYCNLPKSSPVERVNQWMGDYRTAKNSGMTTQEAGDKANEIMAQGEQPALV